MSIQRISKAEIHALLDSVRTVKTKDRAQIGIHKKDVNKAVALGWHHSIIGIHGEHSEEYQSMATTEERFDEATAAVDSAYQRFKEARDKLTGSLRNDAASVASASEKMVASMRRVGEATREVETLLTSERMMQAIANAERLASALTAIAEVRKSEVTFAVIANKEA